MDDGLDEARWKLRAAGKSALMSLPITSARSGSRRRSKVSSFILVFPVDQSCRQRAAAGEQTSHVLYQQSKFNVA
jgi:hypothetical protein